MGITDYYDIPYPELTDEPDGAAQMKAIADRIEVILKNGFTIPSGNLTMGEVGQTTQRLMYFRRRVAPDEYATTLSCGGSQQYIAVYKNDVLQAMHIFRGDGSYLVDVGGVQRPVPFATYVDTTKVIAMTAAATGTVTINFPTGRFTQTPLALATGYGTGAYVVYISTINSTSVQVAARHVDNTAATYSLPINFLAVQMTPTATTGRSEPVESQGIGELCTVTCHTGDCENAEIPIDAWSVTGDDVFCGPCGQPITDVTEA